MDDGSNYEVDEEMEDGSTVLGYDTKHNDYAHIAYWAVCIISAARTSVGDLVPPTYDYWTGRYEDKEMALAQFHILIIWLVFLL